MLSQVQACITIMQPPMLLGMHMYEGTVCCIPKQIDAPQSLADMLVGNLCDLHEANNPLQDSQLT